jgi:hypothetical protein
MIKIIIILFLFSESAKRLHKLRFKKSAKLLGADQRLPILPENDDILVNKIQNHFVDYQYLQYLENPEISILDKKKVAEKVISISTNITNGGLFSDWEYEFETL